MSLRVAVAVFVLIALAAFTVSAAIDERDRARAQFDSEILTVTGEVYPWPEEDPLDCPVYPLVVREYDPGAGIPPPAELPTYPVSVMKGYGKESCSCCTLLPDSTRLYEPLLEEECI